MLQGKHLWPLSYTEATRTVWGNLLKTLWQMVLVAASLVGEDYQCVRANLKLLRWLEMQYGNYIHIHLQKLMKNLYLAGEAFSPAPCYLKTARNDKRRVVRSLLAFWTCDNGTFISYLLFLHNIYSLALWE